MAKNVGWIKLFRKLIDNRIYFIEPFDKIHAWVDLILIADSDGCVDTSIRELADRWKWSVSTTKRYIDLLEKEQMVTTSRSSGGTRFGTENETRSGTRISLVNYSEYQHSRNTVRNTKRNTDEATDWGRGAIDNINIYPRRKEVKEPPISPPQGTSQTDYESEFETIWAKYPKKHGKKNALRDYIKARKSGVERETIEDGLTAYIAYCQRLGRYYKDGSTWFHQESWDDDYKDDLKEMDKPSFSVTEHLKKMQEEGLL